MNQHFFVKFHYQLQGNQERRHVSICYYQKSKIQADLHLADIRKKEFSNYLSGGLEGLLSVALDSVSDGATEVIGPGVY